MQHFPTILNPVEPIKVPYLGGTYHGGDFATYPADNGFDLVQLQRNEFVSHTKAEAAAMLQSWLYFGLLSEILQLDVRSADLVAEFTESHGSGPARYVTTIKLKDYLHKWRVVHESIKHDLNLLAKRRDRTVDALSISHSAWRKFDSFSSIVGAEIELSIQLLATALEHAVTSLPKASIPPKGTFEGWVHVNEAPWRRTPSPYIEGRMERLGWCPSTIRNLGRPAKLGLQTFVSLLTPSFKYDEDEHLDCEFEDDGCRKKNVKGVKHVTKHVAGCDCLSFDVKVFLEIDASERRRILEAGGIPILYLEPGTEATSPTLKMVEHRHELQYTAISHVWADGIGNSGGNGLPICQINRIIRFLNKANWTVVAKTAPKVYNDSLWQKIPIPSADEPTFTAKELNTPPLYFWLDTLCVPISPPELKDTAINSMRAVYSRANRVLALDADLLSTPGTFETLSAEEIVARISASGWIRRFWTLQEGVLAKNLWFQLADQAFKIIDPPDQKENIITHFYDNEIGYYAETIDFRMRKRNIAATFSGRVIAVWSALVGRACSYEEDKALCVAILLDMDLVDLKSVPLDRRTEKLWSMYEEFPLGVLCMPAEKLDDPKQPWALAHVKDCAYMVPPMLVPAIQKDGKLHFSHHGFVITQVLQKSPIGLIAVRLGQEIYFIRQNRKNGNQSWEGIDFESVKTTLAVVLGQEGHESVSGCLGALLSLKRINGELPGGDGVFEGRYLRAVSVIKQGGIIDQMANPKWSADEEAEKLKPLEAKWTNLEQKWEVSG